MYYVQEVTSHSNMPYMTCNDTQQEKERERGSERKR